MSKQLLTIALLLLCHVGSMADSRLFTTDQLTSLLITSIQKDQRGYLWVGTEYGLNRFDGVRFRQYYADAENPTALKEDCVWKLVSDSQGTLWVVGSHYAQRYDDTIGGFIAIDHHFNDLKSMHQLSDGSLVCIDAQNGFFVVDRKTNTVQPHRLLNSLIEKDSGPLGLFEDSRGLLWIWTQNHGVTLYNPKTKHRHHFTHDEVSNSCITAVIEDGSHRLFIIGSTKILHYDHATSSVTPIKKNYPTPLNYRCAGIDKKGRLIAGTFGNGTFRMDSEGVMQSVTSPNNIKYDTGHGKVLSFLSTTTGEWTGCYQAGLLFVSNTSPSFSYYPLENDDKNNNEVLSVLYADRQSGNVWIGKTNDGLTLVDKSMNTVRHILNGTTVISMHISGDGTIYAGTYASGMLRIAKDGSHKETGFGSNRIKAIVPSPLSKDELLVASFNRGLFRYNMKTGTTEQVKGLGNYCINTMQSDSKGRIWIGHYDGATCYNPKTNTFTDVKTSDGDFKRCVCYSICVAHDGKIWFATSKGLWHTTTPGLPTLSEGTIQMRQYTTKDGMPSNMVCAVDEDSQHRMWASTFNGLCMVGEEKPTTFHKGDGLQQTCYARSLYARLGDRFYFGNDYGFTAFNASYINANSTSTPLVITAIQTPNTLAYRPWDTSALDTYASGKTSLEDATSLTFEYDDNTFTLMLSNMNFGSGIQNVEYRINGGSWTQPPGDADFVSFNNMAPGKYLLEARTNIGTNSSPVSSWTITILPPWYLTWWAYLIYICITIAIAVTLWRYWHQRRTIMLGEQRIQFYVDISHELRSPLTLIKSPLSTLQNVKGLDHKAQRALHHIEVNTERLLSLTNQILSIRRIEKGQMHFHMQPVEMKTYISDIIDGYIYVADTRGIKINTDIEEGVCCDIDVEWFDKVVSNLLSNALKYVVDEEGVVDVSMSKADDIMTLSVRDNGDGVDEAQLKRIFQRFYQAENRVGAGMMGYGIGLNLSYKIAKHHHGTISASNRTDGKRGAIFTVTIPCRSSIPEELLRPTAPQEPETPAVSTNTLPDIKTDTPERRIIRARTSYRLAFVDDNENLRDFIHTELSETYTVSTYANGEDALADIIEQQHDVVVTDIKMPKMNGYTLLQRLKSNVTTSHIPVIMLTTLSDHDSLLEGLDKGADAYIPKPFNVEELEAVVANVIENRLRLRGKYSGLQDQEDTLVKVEMKGNDEILMNRIMEIINQNLTDSDFNVEMLVDKIGMSRAQFYRKIKELTGMTGGEFIRGLRMKEAARLLQKTDVGIAQVGYRVGFSSPTNFSVSFKKYFGISPSEYAQQHRSSL